MDIVFTQDNGAQIEQTFYGSEPWVGKNDSPEDLPESLGLGRALSSVRSKRACY